MKKAILCVSLILTFVLTGCSQENNIPTVVWYVENGTFDTLSDHELYKPIENNKTKQIAKLLNKQDKSYKIVFKSYGDSLFNGSSDFIQKLKNKDDDFDIVTFNPIEYKQFLNLEPMLAEKEYKNLANFISKDAWQAHRIHGNSYQIPKPSPYLTKPCYIISKKFKNENNISDDVFKQEYTTMMNELMQIAKNDVKLNNEYNFTSSGVINLRALNATTYISISDIFEHFFEGLLIRKRDHKIVNIYEDEMLRKQLSLNQRIYSENLDGHLENMDLPIVFGASYTFPKEYVENDEELVIPLKETFTSTSIGYGIIKDSTFKEEALKSLQFIYTSKEASNLLIYGFKDKDYTLHEGRAITKKENHQMVPSGTFATLGNDLITYPSEVQPLNKLELAQRYNEVLPQDRIKGFIPNLKPIAKQYKAVNDMYRKILIQLNGTEINDLNAFYDDVNSRLYAIGLQDVIDEIQKQLDVYLKE